MAHADEVRIRATVVDETEVIGVNNKSQLAFLERHYQMGIANTLLEQGVTLLDPARLDVRGDVDCGRDVQIDVNVCLKGRSVLGMVCQWVPTVSSRIRPSVPEPKS